MQTIKATGITLLLLVAAACATVGKNFDSTDLSWISAHHTTKDDVLQRLGEPFRTGLDSGLRTWTYGYYKYRLIGTTATKDLTIYFSQDNTVSSYTFNTSFPHEKRH